MNPTSPSPAPSTASFVGLPPKERGGLVTPTDENMLVGVALRFAAWAERWFPDPWSFAALGVVAVSLVTLARGTTAAAMVNAFSTGFWSLVPFTMQMVFMVIGGFVLATAPATARLVHLLSRIPRSGRQAVCLVALVSMLTSLLSWGLSLVLSGVFVRTLSLRRDLHMDYRAAGAAAYLGVGSIAALGLSSSAALLQANAEAIPSSLLRITGVLPLSQTVFLWQSAVMAAALFCISLAVCWFSAPTGRSIRTAGDLGVAVVAPESGLPQRSRPGEWLEYSPFLSVAISIIGFSYIFMEFLSEPTIRTISRFENYNILFFSSGLLLHWRPRRFIDAAAASLQGISGILLQFPLYGAIATLLSQPQGADGVTLAAHISQFFVGIASRGSFSLVIGVYSAVLGFFVPSGGGKWLVEAPYVMQAANIVHAHLGWTVQIYNAAEALPNLINPFWMLPLLGIIGLKARDLVGFTALQMFVHIPVVFALLWGLGRTLQYIPVQLP